VFFKPADDVLPEGGSILQESVNVIQIHWIPSELWAAVICPSRLKLKFFNMLPAIIQFRTNSLTLKTDMLLMNIPGEK
jgi:hypothetical protein